MPMPLPNLALAHVLLLQRPLQRALHRAAALRAHALDRLVEAGAEPDRVNAEHVRVLFDDIADLLEHRSFSAGAAPLDADEEAHEAELRAKALEQSTRLPLDVLRDDFELDTFEREALVLCVMTELAPEFSRVFAFISDDVVRPGPSLELLVGLTAESLLDRTCRRAALGPAGRLRRCRLLTPGEGAGLRQELRLTDAAIEFLLRGGTAAALGDAAMLPSRAECPEGVEAARLAAVAQAFAEQRLRTIGVWGSRRTDVDDVVAHLGALTQRPLRRWRARELADAREELAVAAALNAMIVIDADAVSEPGQQLSGAVIAELARSELGVIIRGESPWRPLALLSRPFTELTLREATFDEQCARWRRAADTLEPEAAERLAARYKFGPAEIAAAVHNAQLDVTLQVRGLEEALADSCAAVARKGSLRHATLIHPRRKPEDLVLAPELHARVMDIADFYLSMPVVSDRWGLAARRTDQGGIKALFTGDSGTGKTLAAEIVAGKVGLPLLKVDLARVVSKWVGETEKNLDLVFREAEDSHAVLFFDEAEALFGARADVKHGTDRYANLEVSFLLQRLDAFGGVVILASNLKDKIDPAFTRRFHVVIAFPRPPEAERRKLWRQAFPSQTPVRDDVDFQALARLDLTGAGIAGAAQTAALLAAHHHAGHIEMRHLVWGVARQFQRESRILSPTDLGTHARLLTEKVA
jgi:ATPase family associated with various cellular activities (AAA)